jgi:hypothetical protein
MHEFSPSSTISRLTERPSRRQLRASSPQTEQPKILGHMGRKSHTDFSPTSSLTKLVRPGCSGSPSGTAARLQTTRPMSCSRSRPTLPFVSGSARTRSPRNRRRGFHTFPLPVRAGRPGRELCSSPTWDPPKKDSPFWGSNPRKTKRPGACARPVNLELVAGVRFELTTFGL